VSISSTDRSNDKDNITSKLKKSRAEQDSSVSSVKITKEQLSAQDPSHIPDDWDTPGKYHPVCVAIWMAWLVFFVQVFVNKQTIDGSTLHLVPPLLPWEAHPEILLVCLLMQYMPTQLTNSIKGGLHPGSAEHSNGPLLSSCWQLAHQSIGSSLYKDGCVKINVSPWAHPYNGNCTEIFTIEDSLEIMEAYQVFLLLVFDAVARTHLCSQAVQNQVMALYKGGSSFSRIPQGQSGQVLLRSERLIADVLSS
jgi:hypothetical protein